MTTRYAVQVAFQMFVNSPKYVYMSDFPVEKDDLVVTPSNGSSKLPCVAIVRNFMPWDTFRQNPKIKYTSLIQKVVKPNE